MFIRVALASAIFALIGSNSSLQANINTAWSESSDFIEQPNFLLVATRAKDRRDNRQDDRGRQDDREERRDCRDEEGAVGKDKRDCKQDSRQGKDSKDDKDDNDGQ